ncbi:hypothetical protein ACW0US_19200, partial [Xanthomonas euvesicatoria]
MSTSETPSKELRDRISRAMQKDVGISEKMALPLVDAVMNCLAGERPYFPVRSKSYSIEDLRGALADGASQSEVSYKF